MGRPVRLLLAALLLYALPASAQHAPGSYLTTKAGVRLWYESEGNGDPIVLIPGGPGSPHDYFHPEFSRLARAGHRVIYFDPYGRGKSDKAAKATDYSFAGDVEDVEALRTALNLGRITLFGHSYGSIVAEAYATKYPGNVRALILSNPFLDSEALAGVDENADRIMQDYYPEVWEKMVAARKLSAGKKRDDTVNALEAIIDAGLMYDYDPANNATFNAQGGVFNPEVGAGITPALKHFDYRKGLTSLMSPILVLAGRADRIAIPRFTRLFQQFVPKAEFVMFEKSGHDIFLEEPDRFVQVVTTFLSRR
jgi:proline iminopeptidase